MCFDSMRTRADVYDRIMRRKLDSELLVLVNSSMPRFTIDALRVPAHYTTMHASLWTWKPVCVLNKGGSSDLRITSPSAAYEDTREEYLYASFAHRAGYGDYTLVRCSVLCLNLH